MAAASSHMLSALSVAAQRRRRSLSSQAAALAWLTCWALAGGVLVGRRLAGCFDRPLPVGAALLAVTVVLLGVLGARLLRPSLPARRAAGSAYVWCEAAPLALWCGALLVGQPIWCWLLGLMLVVAALVGVSRDWSRRPIVLPRLAAHARRRPIRSKIALRQQYVRGLAPDGAEVLWGRLREPIAAGQRTAVAHVAFCPPFGTIPALAVRQDIGPPARIKVGPLWAHGARVEIKLSRAAVGATVVGLSLSARV